MNDIWLRIEAFFDILSSRNVLIEIGVLAVCLLIGGIVGLELNRRYQRQTDNPPMGLTWQYFSTQVFVVVTPFIVVLVLVLIANSSLLAGHFDVTVCVACSAKTQRERLRARGWSDEQIDQRIAAQWPVEKKMLLADCVVWTEGRLEVHEAQLERIIR